MNTILTSPFMLIVAIVLLSASIYRFFLFIVSMWWLTVNVMYHGKDLTKISYNVKGVGPILFGSVVAIVEIAYWLIHS